MKRELAALEMGSPLSDYSGRTRSDRSTGASPRLVYKRVKRSPAAAAVVVRDDEVRLSIGGVALEDTKAESLGEGERENGEVSTMGVDKVVVENVTAVLMMEVGHKGGNCSEKAEETVVPDKVTTVAETLLKSPSKVANPKGRKLGVERFQRRFTRSALKSNFVAVEQNQITESNNNELGKDCVKRVTRSSISKPKEDGMGSCVTESSDSVLLDKESGEVGVSHDNMNKDVEETETMSGTPRKKLEVKISKQITFARIPRNVRDLFETGLLEGCPVYYDGGKGPGLRGRIRAIGICCSCNLCRGRKVIAPSLFEIHACNSYKRAVQYIFLENGRSLIQILNICKTTCLKSLEATVKNAIGPLPEMVVIVCQNCKEPYSTVDAECSDAVCSACIMSNLSPVGPVYSCRLTCRSSGSVYPSEATSAFGIPPDCNLGKSAYKSTGRLKSAEKSAVVRSNSRARRMLETKTSEKTMEKLSEAESSPKPSKSTRVGKSSSADGRLKTAKSLKKRAVTPKPSKTPPVHGSEKKTNGKITRKDLRLHKLVFEDDVLPDGTELGYYAKGKKLLDGFKKGPGIYCNCCETVISASQFEAHAGCAARRKPYCYIYTSNGVSLHELSVNLVKERQHSTKYNDDLCSICADGGDLLLCDGCPRAFHMECASLSSIPSSKWYCKYCENMFEREKFVAHNANALAAGRVTGVDPMEQITQRSIRIVYNVGSEASSCILCRGYDFCKTGFGPRTIILCDQCEKEYHVGCLKDHNMADLTELPEGKWFCSVDCERIESALQNLLVQGEEKLPESFLNIINRKNLQYGSECATDVDVRWRLLNGKIAYNETRPLLSQAVAIFHESFAPIVDVVSGHDLIPAMVYGRNVGGQEYGGMYCAVLIINSVVVSAGIFRIFGPEVSELPLVATSSGNHGKGYFQALFACIERFLSLHKIKTLVLPAAEEAESIWTDRFGFKKMTPDQLRELKSNFWSMVRFQGTAMLHKPVPEYRNVERSADHS